MAVAHWRLVCVLRKVSLRIFRTATPIRESIDAVFLSCERNVFSALCHLIKLGRLYYLAWKLVLRQIGHPDCTSHLLEVQEALGPSESTIVECEREAARRALATLHTRRLAAVRP